jgi:tRNA pseudouridine55 synthase
MSELNGILIIKKERGMTSHDVVAEVRKILHTREVGHTGTLDPDATGVLPVCVGRATKLAQFFLSSDKEYEATLVLGIRTDTQDSTGDIVSEVKNPDIGDEEIQEVFSKLTGEIQQIPPMVSAPLIRFKVVCSKGTYIRTLCADIGDMLDCGAHQAELIRLRSGLFRLSDSVTLKELRELPNPGERIIPPDAALSHFPSVEVRDWFGEIMKKNALISSVNVTGMPEGLKAGEFVRVSNSRGELLAVGVVEADAGVRVAWLHKNR